MSKCKFCGSELQEGTKFCSTCGAKADETLVVDGVVRNVPPNNNSQSSAWTSKPSKHPLRAGMLAWSIVNIVAGLGSCCCFTPFISIVLGIISLIYTLLATDCVTEQVAKNRIRIARILNIIATCITVISIIVYIVLIILGFLASGGFDEFMRYYYYFD